ncbi:hypothetical protein [Gordonia sp. NB41Y]|uniref:hypothetical protein n=1 Tax=Gordonia sp. NB41Y TaxID=875808 RepID=UPI0006B15EB3|nr:hypothetical protein [Gordonia sp. NB41Y]KOY49675.1 hypothetical protein ISGA_08670 [Gordonia sp. NB41Y]WLP92158.1 hypothetical protein Q9K23_07985 [Gordonia sp. NB41Y]
MRSPDIFHALVLLNLLFACGLWTLLRPSVRAAVTLLVVAVAWVIWNGPIEGATLVTFTRTNGLTESDLLSVGAAGISLWTLARVRRQQPIQDLS